jgi:hypothetical protein
MASHRSRTVVSSLWMPASLWALVSCNPEATSETADTASVPSVIGRCEYVNPFSDAPECKEYYGTNWTDVTAAEDCRVPVISGAPGTYTAGATCEREALLGECIVDGGGTGEVRIVFTGEDPSACSGAELGCSFSQGMFVPAGVCAASSDPGVPSATAFVPFQKVCVDPIAGESSGEGPNGQVCTWEAISGCTEEGRAYADYASCEPVYTQRPYWAAAITVNTDPADARLSDSVYLDELAWVTAQVESSACVCCHTQEHSPSQRPSGWYLEASQLWVDGLENDGLAVLAGWVDSTAFGAFPAEENNGFHRDETGIPTTDPARMKAFLEGELTRRGLTQEDFATTEPFGGPLYDQLFYAPEPCTADQGIDAEGRVQWTGGPARYLYVLEDGSQSPGVPPNLDLPSGTLWRLDVAPSDSPIQPGTVTYGSVPTGATQAFPESGSPADLIAGETYYLVALRDIYQPATRCLFTAR